ncbi:MAG: LysM peptidoglycan-binding domain-containing protein [Bacteroidota bacterium]
MFSYGKVVKLTIYAFEDESFSEAKKIGDPFELQINPSQYQHNFKINYDASENIGQGDQQQQFRGIESQNFTLEFTLDGTGVVNNSLFPGQGLLNLFTEEETVSEKVARLKDLAYHVKSETHQPSFLKIVWGDEDGIFKGVLDTLQVTYTLFSPEGAPLRAKINMAFKSHISKEEQDATQNLQSPDLTHVRTVKAGDTLPLMAYRIYGDSRYYLEVARVNELTNFRQLEVGSELFFPPIDKDS